MRAYLVKHNLSGMSYHVLAMSSAEAIERVTLHLADIEGLAAWTAQPETSPFEISRGVILDADGKPVQTLDA